jgi:hypothetical protein
MIKDISKHKKSKFKHTLQGSSLKNLENFQQS